MLIPINHKRGSNYSIAISKALQNCTDLNIFGTKFVKALMVSKYKKIE